MVRSSLGASSGTRLHAMAESRDDDADDWKRDVRPDGGAD